MSRISVNLTHDCDGNQLNYNNDLPAIGNKNYGTSFLLYISYTYGKNYATSFLLYIYHIHIED